MIEGICERCRIWSALKPIQKQIGGRVETMYVCPACYKKHWEDIERRMQDFQAQVDALGGKV
jgi:protein-arginine kinase activator protein McsA